jgi:predicted transcriptional regulator
MDNKEKGNAIQREIRIMNLLETAYTTHKEAEGKTSNVLNLVSEVVAAYVSNNALSSAEVPDLIHQVYTTLLKLKQMSPGTSFLRNMEPVVPIEDSIKEDYIVCLEDGKKLKMLKRHLRAVYNMSPEQYRERWGLPVTYPMVAPNYAKKRSHLAKINGLGHSSHRKKAL